MHSAINIPFIKHVPLFEQIGEPCTKVEGGLVGG